MSEFQKADYYITELVNGRIIGYTSCLTWDEVFYIIMRQSNKNDAIIAGSHILGLPNLNFLEVDLNIITSAQSLISNYNIRPRDAIHAASALEYTNGSVISNDSDFDSIAGVKRTF